MLKTDGIYFAYLRKSREDRDAEKNGAEDTLARHEYIINEMVKRYNIHIMKWYREVVSGETIEDRPEMLSLLSDVETLHPDGVLVVEVERLSRGNPQDQGRVMDTFKYSNTLIITPMKIYDLTQQNDEEWIDFGLLRSRMEYRTINRRLQNGRTTSAMQGKYIGNIPPYGWNREKLKGEKGYTLVPNPDTHWVLPVIYKLLETGTAETDYKPVGINKAARVLDALGAPPPNSKNWLPGSVSRIAKNPVNIGYNRVGYRKQQKKIVDGKKVLSRPINEDCILVPARWTGCINKELFDSVCTKLKKNSRSRTFHDITNPLAGIITCNICGHTLTRRPGSANQPHDYMLCTTYGCKTCGARYNLVESRLIDSLEQFLANYKLNINDTSGIDYQASIQLKKKKISNLKKEREKESSQLSKIQDLLEQNIYDLQTYLKRSQLAKDKIAVIDSEISTVEQALENLSDSVTSREVFIPYFESVLTSYKSSTDPKYKNELLKSIVTSVEYTKNTRGTNTGKGLDDFTLDIHINLQGQP